MRKSLVHRGPDGYGRWGDDVVELGHQRLSILDLSEAGTQPMVSASGRFVLVFNGEVYNYQDLGSKLTSSGWKPRSDSDTEVLVEGFDHWGVEQSLEQVDGMFAFVLYDRMAHHLILGRDRFGEKPLYYGVHKGLVSFASELRAFDFAGGPELFLDPQSTASYFRYGYVPAPKSIYSGIFKVRPGTVIRIDLSQPVEDLKRELPATRYWEIPTSTDFSVNREEELRVALRRSVTRRLLSDRPIGAFLSGGIDSSLTCALAAESTSGSLQTFTMGWPNPEYDESNQAKQVASALGSTHRCVEATTQEAADVMTDIGRLLDEPHADSSFIATYLVAREARKNIVVAISGDGGDELFAGYNRHLWLIRVAAMRNRLPHWARRLGGNALRRTSSAIGIVAKPVPVVFRPRLVADKSAKLGRALVATNSRIAYEVVAASNQSIRGQLDLPMATLSSLESDDRTDMLRALRSADMTYYLPDDVLTKVDRATMAVSLESRTPFLQPDVARIAVSLTYEDLISGNKGKQPLRKFLSDLLPDCDFSQPKTGFGTPIASVLRGFLRDITADSFDAFSRRNLPQDVVTVDWGEIHRRFMDGDDSVTFHVWSVLVFELWAAERRHVIDWK